MQASLKLHVIHVSGKRMISHGTDGLSRGNLTSGVFSHSPMSLYIPLHLSAIEHSPALLPWLQDWLPEPSCQPLTPEEWYTAGHGIGGSVHNLDGVWMPTSSNRAWLLWSPPPAAGCAAMEEASVSRHKRTGINHVFVFPRLFTSQW